MANTHTRFPKLCVKRVRQIKTNDITVKMAIILKIDNADWF